MHYTPTHASWINQVERWFAYITDDLLRRSDQRSVQALGIRAQLALFKSDVRALRHGEEPG